MSYCNDGFLAWVVELCKRGQLDRQKEGVLKRNIDSGTNYQLSWLKHLDPGCPGLGDGPRCFVVSGGEINW